MWPHKCVVWHWCEHFLLQSYHLFHNTIRLPPNRKVNVGKNTNFFQQPIAHTSKVDLWLNATASKYFPHCLVAKFFFYLATHMSFCRFRWISTEKKTNIISPAQKIDQRKGKASNFQGKNAPAYQTLVLTSLNFASRRTIFANNIHRNISRNWSKFPKYSVR